MNKQITIKVNGEYVNVRDGDTVEVSPPVFLTPKNTSLSPSITKAVEAIVSDLIINTIEVSGPAANRMISAEDAGAISIKHDRKANQAIIRLIQQAELGVWEQVAIETRSCICDCGEKWSKSDLGIRAEVKIAQLKQLEADD